MNKNLRSSKNSLYPLMYGRFSGPFRSTLRGSKTIFFYFFRSIRATKSVEGIFRYGLPEDILSKGQKTTAYGDVSLG